MNNVRGWICLCLQGTEKNAYHVGHSDFCLLFLNFLQYETSTPSGILDSWWVQFSGTLQLVWQKFTHILEGCTTSIFRIEEWARPYPCHLLLPLPSCWFLDLTASCWFLAWLTLQPWKSWWYVPPKHQPTFTGLYGIIL
jgi:hypothetical protein